MFICVCVRPPLSSPCTDAVCDAVKKAGTVDSKVPSERSEGGGAGGEVDGGKGGASREQKKQTEVREMSEDKPSTETRKFAEPEALAKPHGEKYTPKVRIWFGFLLLLCVHGGQRL